MVHALDIRTRARTELVEVTAEIRAALGAAGLRDGVLVAYCPHTTAGLTVQENADPDVRRDLNRWMPLVKWFLAIPHYVVLAFLAIGACFAGVVAWFAILFTGQYPRGLFDFIVGVGRWGLRVNAYAFLLVTDRYPPFSLR